MDKATRAEVDFVNKVLLDLFEHTCQRFHESGGLFIDERTRKVCELLYPFTDSRQLETALPSGERLRGGFRDRRMLLFLEFTEREPALPVLDMNWDFATGTKRSTIRFRFFLLQWKDGDPRPRAVGFRLEPPEGDGAVSGQSGSHNYWHAQMIAELEKGDDLLSKIVGHPNTWVPTKQPAFPLPAKSLGDLLVVLLLSIYGAKQLARLLVAAEIRGDLAERLKGMDIRISSTSGHPSPSALGAIELLEGGDSGLNGA
jgi:hypothetical protein